MCINGASLGVRQAVVTEQIRAGRAALGWSGKHLAEASGVSLRTIAKLEAGSGVPAAHAQTLEKIRTTLEAAGIEFIGTPTDAPGIRLHGKTQRGA